MTSTDVRFTVTRKTATKGEILVPRYSLVGPDRNEMQNRLPEQVILLDDGRVLARYRGAEHLFADGQALHCVHPYTQLDRTGELLEVVVESMPATSASVVDWAEVHHVMAELDRARRGSSIGHDGVTDALGGEYRPYGRSTLAGLVRLATAVDRIARDAWTIVHQARDKGTDLELVRCACRVAIGCSRAFAVLHRAGVIADPSSRICGTGEGYGLTGLRWLAGERVDLGTSSATVERFAAGGELV